jgi:hypothetical protein
MGRRFDPWTAASRYTIEHRLMTLVHGAEVGPHDLPDGCDIPAEIIDELIEDSVVQ